MQELAIMKSRNYTYPGKTDKPKRTIGLNERCQQLKREPGAVETLISEMEKLAQKNSLTKTIKENLQAALTYFKNHRQMMDYAMHIQLIAGFSSLVKLS